MNLSSIFSQKTTEMSFPPHCLCGGNDMCGYKVQLIRLMTLWIEFNECDEFKTFANKYLYCFSTFTLIHCHFHNNLSFPSPHTFFFLSSHHTLKMYPQFMRSCSTQYKNSSYIYFLISSYPNQKYISECDRCTIQHLVLRAVHLSHWKMYNYCTLW